MDWIISHYALVLTLAIGAVSEALSIVQTLKYPTNQGVGGILTGILKLLNFLKDA